MIFRKEEFNKVAAIILFPENQIWKDILYLFTQEQEKLEIEIDKISNVTLDTIDELENIIFYKIESFNNNQNILLFEIAKYVIKFVVELEEFFDTDLEKSCPEVRIIYNMILKMGVNTIGQKSFRKIRSVVEHQVELEIQGNHNPSTITALNCIINATDNDFKSASFHSIKEAVNTWIPYFIQEYSNFGHEDRKLIIKALKLMFLKDIIPFLI
jgi:hypothetical protein